MCAAPLLNRQQSAARNNIVALPGVVALGKLMLPYRIHSEARPTPASPAMMTAIMRALADRADESHLGAADSQELQAEPTATCLFNHLCFFFQVECFKVLGGEEAGKRIANGYEEADQNWKQEAE